MRCDADERAFLQRQTLEGEGPWFTMRHQWEVKHSYYGGGRAKESLVEYWTGGGLVEIPPK
jgi:hypothetical protein